MLQDLATREIDRMVCLGDSVEGGEANDAVVALLRSLPCETIRGNHDAIHDCALTAEHAVWLSALPEHLRWNDLLFTHMSPRCKSRAITDSAEAWNVFDETDCRLCVIGHLHYPALYGYVNDAPCEAHDYPADHGIVQLDPSDRYIVSFGAIGYPRAGGRVIRYGIIDLEAQTLEFIALPGPLLPYEICAR